MFRKNYSLEGVVVCGVQYGVMVEDHAATVSHHMPSQAPNRPIPFTGLGPDFF